MVSTQEVKDWVTHRIDYWEDELDKKDSLTTADIIEARSILAGFYMVVEFINGQRR